MYFLLALLTTVKSLCYTDYQIQCDLKSVFHHESHSGLAEPLRPCPAETIHQPNTMSSICVSVQYEDLKDSWPANTIDFCSSWNFPYLAVLGSWTADLMSGIRQCSISVVFQCNFQVGCWTHSQFRDGEIEKLWWWQRNSNVTHLQKINAIYLYATFWLLTPYKQIQLK